MKSDWYQLKPGDKIWWRDNLDTFGEYLFSFDRETEFNLFVDYPRNLTPEQRRLFDKENPYWAKFFSDRR